MRPSRVKAKFQRNEPALIIALHLIDPSVFELASLMGFDGIWMDMEHHPYGLGRGAEMMRAARVGTSDIIARPAKGEFMRMQRMLEAGAQGIIYPRCDNAQEAAEVVRWAKFAPQGQRGCDGANADAPYLMMPLDEYIAAANRQTFVILQIESPESLVQAEAIAAVEGVDALMLGPGDYSILSGIVAQWSHPRILQAKEAVARAAQNTGKHWGCPAFSADDARQLLDMGAGFVCHGNDLVLIKQGLERIQGEFHRLGFSFGSG